MYYGSTRFFVDLYHGYTIFFDVVFFSPPFFLLHLIFLDMYHGNTFFFFFFNMVIPCFLYLDMYQNNVFMVLFCLDMHHIGMPFGGAKLAPTFIVGSNTMS